MQRHFMIDTQQLGKYLGCAALLASLATIPLNAQDAKGTIDRAIAATHSQDVESLQIEGHGFDALFGQAYDGDSAWPRFTLTRYRLAVSFKDDSLREERTRVQLQNPPLGGGNQPIGEQRQTLLFRDGCAWGLNAQGAAAPSGVERDLRAAAEARQLEMLFTPQGFLKFAHEANATARQVQVADKTETVLSFTLANKTKVEGTLDADGLPRRVRTLVETPVLGDVVLDAVFSDYRDYGGILFPQRIVQSEGGYPLLDLTVTSIKPNAVDPIVVPENIREAVAKVPAPIKPQSYGEGIWILPGDDYHASKSILAEFKDYLLVVEAPDSEERSLAVIEAAHKLVPGKPIRYIVNTHTHFDHSGGLRTYAAEGATIVTWEGNIAYYREVWSNPHSIHPDRLATSKRVPEFEGVTGSRTFTDGEQEVVVCHYAGNFHNPGMLAVYLPKQRAVIEADSFNPQPNPNDPPTAIPNLVQFNEAVYRLGLAVDEIIPIHGRIAPYEEVLKDIEAYKGSQLWQ
jgi:glyoxylase-like metal-dependent hydrolase (beta-lactamase superfamily II)